MASQCDQPTNLPEGKHLHFEQRYPHMDRMSHLSRVAIHETQFPERVKARLLRSLRGRAVAHKFHYDSIKQTQRWLAIHEAFSPFRTQDDVARQYESAAHAVAAVCSDKEVCVVGLGCGGGKKDRIVIEALLARGKRVHYVPTDVSAAMVLVAQQTVASLGVGSAPLVWDMEEADDWASVLDELEIRPTARVYTFYGMLPNFDPEIVAKLSRLVRPSDFLLVSANLAPGDDYAKGVERVLPLYDNAPTRAWLMTFLNDLGVEPQDGEMGFFIAPDPGGELIRIECRFTFSRRCSLKVETEEFRFKPGDEIRLFFSYRHTPALLAKLLGRYRLSIEQQWIASSGEEGVFLVAKA